MIEFILQTIPWWVWAFPVVAAGVPVVVVLSRVIGWRNALMVLPALWAATAIPLSRLRGRQEGWQARVQKDISDAERLVQRIKKARQRVRDLPPERLRDNDGYRRD